MRLVSDDTWAVMTIWAEARGEPFEGQCAVGEVIRLRTKRRYASNGTIPGTILWPWQFSCWNINDPQRLKMALLDDEDLQIKKCAKAWKASASSHYSKGAVLYCNLKIARPNWAIESKKVAQIGNHTFFAD